MFGKKKKILVLEDDTALSRVLCIKFQKEGFNTVAVESGDAAINEIDTKKFDLALIDLMVPRVDGFSVLKYFREKNDTIPIFIVSNLSQKEDMDRVFEMGATKYFVKSNVSLTEILKEAKEVLKT